MPWCERCDRFTGAVGDGERRCESCGEQLAPPAPVPWHFKLLLVAVVLYLGLRAVQGVAWLLDRLG